jgi:hypothetical protein
MHRNDYSANAGMNISSNPHGTCYDTSCPICQNDGNKGSMKNLYYKQSAHDDKINEIERQRQLEDFKYNVAKNCSSIEK